MTLLEVIADESEQPVTPETAVSELGDSLDFLTLIRRIEDVFDVTVPDDAIGEISTVADLCAIVEPLREARRKESNENFVSS